MPSGVYEQVVCVSMQDFSCLLFSPSGWATGLQCGLWHQENQLQHPLAQLGAGMRAIVSK